MTNTTKLMVKLAVAISLIGGAAFGAATPSLAQSSTPGSHYYEPGDNGSAWSFYPGYTDEDTAQRPAHRTPAYNAHAEVRGFNNSGRAMVDDPPGSAFQTRGNNASMGCPC
jgi:hypothetical protein